VITRWASFTVLATSFALCITMAVAQESGTSLADLARKERERKSAVSKPARVLETLDEFTNCGANWECFIQAAADRIPAKLSITDTVNLGAVYGWVITSEVRLEIRDCTEQTCLFTGRTENTKLKFTEEMRQRFLASGTSAAQIDEQEKAAERRVARQDEALVKCTFQLAKLKEFLGKRRQGSTDDEDWKLADRCDGLDQTVNNPFASPVRQ